ncbi:MAG TPA: hypothetical protein VHD90_06360 [Phototrophicaceae bacterium]|nr:hypothetical protein [Phototrophicaceae bacterium]
MHRRPNATRNFVLLIAGLLFVVSIPLVLARQQLVQPDGRINQVAHFGGDALYCVDGNRNPTRQLPTTDPGGFRLLNMNGQELWFVPGHDVEAALEKSVIGGDWQLIASGSGTYGPVSLHTWNVGGQNGIFYEFIGYDEHGKSNTLIFQSCIVGPAVGSIPTWTLKPSGTLMPSQTFTDGPSPTPSDTPTGTSSPTATDTPTGTSSPTATDTATSTSSPTPTDTPTDVSG